MPGRNSPPGIPTLAIRHGVSVQDVAVTIHVHPSATWTRRAFLALLERHVDFAELRALCDDPHRPKLVVGTVDSNAGEFETVTNAAVTAEGVLASTGGSADRRRVRRLKTNPPTAGEPANHRRAGPTPMTWR